MILDRFRLTDRVALVTGGGKGIGRGIALGFAEAGADLVVAARTAADLEATAEQVRERGRRALPVVADVTRTEDLERLVDAALAEFGRIDVLVNNAGGTGPRAALQTSERYFEAALNMMTRNLAAEFAPKVRVNALSVGGVATEALQVVLTNDALREQFEKNTPLGRPGSVEDIAAAALYLASPASSWVTGKIFQVDGGTEEPAISVPTPPL